MFFLIDRNSKKVVKKSIYAVRTDDGACAIKRIYSWTTPFSCYLIILTLPRCSHPQPPSTNSSSAASSGLGKAFELQKRGLTPELDLENS